MKKFVLFLLLSVTMVSHAQELRLKKGVVLDTIPMVSDSLASYALYLPTSFTMNTKWPVLFAFDPQGDGQKAVNVFKGIAEKYGIIVVASNTIKNDLLETNLVKFNKLSIEIAKNFPVNSSRIFTAGLSGGARLATTIAVISKKMEAVIACGASFSTNVAYYPQKPNFYFIGIVGKEDFSYVEMTSAKTYLDNKKIPNELLVFNGGHNWPDEQTIDRAFNWIQFQYLLKNKKLSTEQIEKQYTAYLKLADSIANIDKEAAIRYLNRISENYKMVSGTDSLKKKIRILKKDPVYKANLRRDQEAILEEEDLKSMYALYFQEDIEKVNMDNLAWWENQFKQIDSFTVSKDYFKVRTGKRIQGLFYTAAKEVAMTLKDSTSSEKWLYINIFTTLVNKKDRKAYFNIIQYGAQKLNYDLALYYTEELFENGFTDLEKLKSISGASLFFVSPAYLELEDTYFEIENIENSN